MVNIMFKKIADLFNKTFDQCSEAAAAAAMASVDRFSSILPGEMALLKNAINSEHAFKKASVIFVYDPDTELILATHRKKNASDWGLPGGKKEPGESPLQCAIREFEEETPYTIANSDSLCWLCDMREIDFMVSVFTINPSDITASISENQEYQYAWVSSELLVSGSFADFNRKLFKMFLPKT